MSSSNPRSLNGTAHSAPPPLASSIGIDAEPGSSSPVDPQPVFTDAELGLEFPCEFPIKVMGRDKDDFAELVLELIGQHIDSPPVRVQQRSSSSGKYLSLTVTVTASSRDQLDSIYRALNGHDRILMTL